MDDSNEESKVTQSADVSNLDELLRPTEPKNEEDPTLQDSLFHPELSEKIEDSPNMTGGKAIAKLGEDKSSNPKRKRQIKC